MRADRLIIEFLYGDEAIRRAVEEKTVVVEYEPDNTSNPPSPGSGRCDPRLRIRVGGSHRPARRIRNDQMLNSAVCQKRKAVLDLGSDGPAGFDDCCFAIERYNGNDIGGVIPDCRDLQFLTA